MDGHLRELGRQVARGEPGAEISLLRAKAHAGDTNAQFRVRLLEAGLPLHLSEDRARLLAYVGDERARRAVQHWADCTGWSMDWGRHAPGKACYPDVYRIIESSPTATTWTEGLRRLSDFPSGREVMTTCPNIGRKHGRPDYYCGRCKGADKVPESMSSWVLLNAALAASRIGLMSMRKGRIDEPTVFWPSRHRHTHFALEAGDAYAQNLFAQNPMPELETIWSHAMVNLIPVDPWLMGPGSDPAEVILAAAREFGESAVRQAIKSRVTTMILGNDGSQHSVWSG